MAIAAQKNQGFQHRVRHAGTVWAHYEPTLVKISVKICIWLEQTMPTHKKTCSNNGSRSGNLLHRLLIDTSSSNSEFFILEKNSRSCCWVLSTAVWLCDGALDVQCAKRPRLFFAVGGGAVIRTGRCTLSSPISDNGKSACRN